MTPIATIIWISNLLSDTVGQLAFKAAATHGGDEDGIQRWIAMAKNKWIWIGLIAYVFEVVLWIAFLGMVPLSLGVLLGSLNIFCVMLGGRIIFKEPITKRRAIAVSLIVLGVVLVGVGAGQCASSI